MGENLANIEELLIGGQHPQLPQLSKMSTKCFCVSRANFFQWTQKALNILKLNNTFLF